MQSISSTRKEIQLSRLYVAKRSSWPHFHINSLNLIFLLIQNSQKAHERKQKKNKLLRVEQ